MANPVTFGLTPVRAARSAAVVVLLGVAGVGAVARMAAREGSPLHAFVSGIGLSATVLFVAGTLLVLTFALIGARKALAAATQFAITAEGLIVHGQAGMYLLGWDNIERLGTLFDRDLGISVRSREAVLSSHEGTAEQRERFERQLRDEPYQGWDFHYYRHELGMPVDRVFFLLEQARDPNVLLTRLDDGQIVDG
jgi:hypothetical protein